MLKAIKRRYRQHRIQLFKHCLSDMSELYDWLVEKGFSRQEALNVILQRFALTIVWLCLLTFLVALLLGWWANIFVIPASLFIGGYILEAADTFNKLSDYTLLQELENRLDNMED